MISKNNFSQERLKSLIWKILSDTLRKEVNERSLKMVSFVDLELTNDHSLVKVYVDYFDLSKIEMIVKKLNVSKGIFRTALSKKLTIHRVPEILFVSDRVAANVEKIESIINSIHSKNQKNK